MPQSAAGRPNASSALRNPCIREAGPLAPLSPVWISHRGLQFTRKEVFNLWCFYVAINATKFASAGFHQHESHRLAALEAGWRWRVLGHAKLALI
jgi:hypothetical protein